MLAALSLFFKHSKREGMFINSCFAHCQSESQDTWLASESPRVRNKLVILEQDGRSYPVRVIEVGDLLTESMDGGDQSSAMFHGIRKEGDDVGIIVADVGRSLDMGNGKKTTEGLVGTGSNHMCNSASISVVNETVVEMEICNHALVHSIPNSLGLENDKAIPVVEGNQNEKPKDNVSIDDESSPSEEEGEVDQPSVYDWANRAETRQYESRVQGKF
ncbi:Pectin acetylesterase 9 [Camellia lanceoleosa]|uniref:Pectin acetylesterase 9 n=1 Tax=Camellia lanceoleosa TaxID=1840588 RepID=A0ACC0G7G8_9ERIC|nr:Pectin acetylesterase 9 [Camellia lanceoleosa]